MDESETSGRHPIQVVARRTGLTPDVIRVWERRYDAVGPARSRHGRRLYTDEEVERLVLLRRATLGGRRIGEVALLPLDELDRLVDSDARAAAEAPRPGAPAAGREPGPLAAGLEAVERLDAAGLEAALDAAMADLGTAGLLDQVLGPLLRGVGDRWRDGRLRVAHEHLASALVRSFLSGLRVCYGAPGNAPDLVVTTPAGQLHEFGALMAAVAAAGDGWSVTYLGPCLPAEEIAAAARARGSRAVALSLVYPPDDPRVSEELRRLRRLLPDAPILVGGAAAPAYEAALREVGADRLDGMQELRARLDALRRPPG